MFFFIIIIIIIIISAFHHTNTAQTEYNEIVERTGYGVFFQHVGNMLVHEFIEYFPFTFLIHVPKFIDEYQISYLELPPNDNMDELFVNFVNEFNDILEVFNKDVAIGINNMRFRFKEFYHEFDHITTFADFLKDTAYIDDYKTNKKKRKKRYLTVEELQKEAEDALTEGDDDANNFKKKKHLLRTINNSLPPVKVGSALNRLGGLPDAGALDNIKIAISDLAHHEQLQENQVRIMRETNGAYFKTIDNRLSNMVESIKNVRDGLLEIRKNTQEWVIELAQHTNATLKNILTVNKMNYILGTFMYPAMHNVTVTYKELLYVWDKWSTGLEHIHMGTVPFPELINHDMMKFAIETIEQIIHSKTKSVNSKNHMFNNVKLAFTNTMYYGLMRDTMTYLFTPDSLSITLQFPMIRVDKVFAGTSQSIKSTGSFNLYRVFTYPVPITAGTKLNTDNVDENDCGFTQLISDKMSDYLAVSYDLDYYIPLSTEQLLSCTGNVAGIYKCDSYVIQPAVKRSTHKQNIDCTFALFIDNAKLVKEKCDVSYKDIPPKGFIVNIPNTNQYLVISEKGCKETEEGNNRWDLVCPQSTVIGNPTKEQMVKVEVPCGCLLRTETSETSHMWNDKCNNDVNFNELYKIYTRNAFAEIHNISFPELAIFKSNLEKINEHFENLHIPKVEYQLAGEELFNKSISELNKVTQDYKKIAKLQFTSASKPFRDKEDEAYKKATDLSNQRTERSFKVFDSVNALFDFFGDDVKAILGFIFSASGVILIFLALDIICVLPRLMKSINTYRNPRTEKKEQEEEITNLLSRNDYGYYYDDTDKPNKTNYN